MSAGKHCQDSLEIGAKTPAGNTSRQPTAGDLSTVLASQPMEAIFGHQRLNLGQFSDLMDQGIEVLTSQGMTTPAAQIRFTVDRLVNSFRLDNGPVGFAMPRLSPAVSLTRRGWGLPLHAHGFRRRRFGRVGGVQPETSFQVTNARLQLSNPLMHGEERCCNGSLSVRRDLVPKLIRDRQRIVHSADVALSSESVNPRA
jgi:hypothetical protein